MACGRDERGIACGAQALRRRRPRSSRRSHNWPGRAGKPPAGRRRPGDGMLTDRKVFAMQSAETVLGVLRERGSAAYRVPSCTGRCSTRSCICCKQRADLRQQGCDDAWGQTGSRRWHVWAEDRRHHRCDAPRALPVHARPADLHPEKNGELRPLGSATPYPATNAEKHPAAPIQLGSRLTAVINWRAGVSSNTGPTRSSSARPSSARDIGPTAVQQRPFVPTARRFPARLSQWETCIA